MKTVFHLSTCSTCKRIISELSLEAKDFTFRDLKDNPLTQDELNLIRKLSGLSNEELFSKRSMKYSKGMFTTDSEFGQAILSEYTFVKRPIIISAEKIFVGNAPKVVAAAKEAI